MDTSPGTLLKLLVAQKAWRYRDFAAAFERTAAKAGLRSLTVSEAQFRRWTSGRVKTLPTPDACRVLEALFGTEAVSLFAEPPRSVPTTVPTAYEIESEIAMTARDAADEAGTAAAQSVSDTTIDQLRDDVTILADTYAITAPFDVFRKAKGLRQDAEYHRGATQVPAQQQELLILAGQACALLSTAAFDLGALDDSTRLARSAALYGETARFDPLRAYATGSLAIVAYFTGRPSEAVRHARSALAYGGLGDAGRRRLLSIAARAHAHLGDGEQADRATTAAAQLDTNTRDDLHDGVGGEFAFDEERLVMSAATTALLTGNGPQAEAQARRALHLVAERPPARQSATVRAKASADLAAALLKRGELEAAAEALTPVWDLPGDRRSSGLLDRVTTLRTALTTPSMRTTPVALDLGERIEDYSRRSAHTRLTTRRNRAIEP
ncbi:DNA-binding protein [Streptomyces sp. NPDC058734]|uniref:DNA-binding protein n=1 Tax=Streptomyces sp. NPDC058734 TaxID=3346615 RepID=UPI0036A45804